MKHFLFSLSFCLVTLYGFGQGIQGSNVNPFYFKENIPKSPEVASLGTYGQFQANPYNGKANISIPLHTIDFEGLQIPITLSYNSTGVRVAQDAGMVGLNWNLSTNFGITRTIYGPDDFDDNTAPNQQEYYTDIDVPDNGYIYNFYEVPAAGAGATPSVPGDYYYRVFGSFLLDSSVTPSREIDTQPDFFEANIFGVTYKFRLTKKGNSNTVTAKVFNNNNVQITLDLSTMSFTLVDDQGFTYFFSSKEKSTTFVPIDGASGFGSVNGPGAYPGFLVELRGDRDKTDEEVITHWYLDQVTSPLGAILNFTYTDGLSLTFPSPQASADHFTNILSDYENGGSAKEPIGTTTVIKQKYLTAISGDFGSVDFELGSRADLCTLDAIYRFAGYNNLLDANFSLYTKGLEIKPSDQDRSKKLDRILVKDHTGTTKKTINFHTSYFNANKANDPVKERYLRLKLDGVTINDRNYDFSYLDSNSLPPKDSRSIDFWGFYNGVTNTQLVPSIGRFITSLFTGGLATGQYFLNFNGGVRKSDFNYGKIGLLDKITYPTSGSTSFIYEPHDVVLASTPPFKIQEYFNLYGVDRIKWTNMTDENSYNFTYQYLKYANDPNYDYYDLTIPTGGGELTEIALVSGQVFTVDVITELSMIGQLTLPADADNLPLPYDIYVLENMDTGEEIGVINLVEGPNSTGVAVPLEKSIFVSPGTYQFRYVTPIGSPMVFTGAFTLQAYNNSNLDISDFYERFEIGGARVAQIINRDANDEFINSVGYRYEHVAGTNGLKSSGKLMDELIFFSTANGYHSYNPHSYNQRGITLTSYSTVGNTPSAQGSHIGYSFVQERQLDVNGNALGRTDRVFTNSPNVYFKESWAGKPWAVTQGGGDFGHIDVRVSNTVVLGLPPKYNSESSNGLLESETIYNAAGEIVRETENAYKRLEGTIDQTYFTKFMPIWQISHPGTLGWDPGYNTFTTFNQYFHYQTPLNYFERFALNYSKTVEHFPDGDLSTETTTLYDPITHYPAEQAAIYNDTDTQKENFFYASDDAVTALTGVNLLRAENRQGTLVRKKSFRNSKLLSTEEYLYESSSARTQNKVLMTTLRSAKGNNPLETQMEVEFYDAEGNMLQSHTRDGMRTAYIWGYNNQYVIAKIENATYAAATALLGNNPNLDNGLSTAQATALRNGLPNAMVTTYSYDPLVGLTRTTDPRGYTTYYEYDDQNRLKAVKDAENHLLTDYLYHYRNQGNN